MNVLTKWNNKWKLERLPLVTEFSKPVVDFLTEATITDGYEEREAIMDEDDEYIDEDEYSQVITFKRGRHEHTLRIEEWHISIDGSALESFFSISNGEANRLESFLRKFDFEAMSEELGEERLQRGSGIMRFGLRNLNG
jgi:hypothetical protein